MSEQFEVFVNGESYPIQADLDTRKWSASASFDEGDFPLVVHSDGKRYELYSDGSLGEVES